MKKYLLILGLLVFACSKKENDPKPKEVELLLIWEYKFNIPKEPFEGWSYCLKDKDTSYCTNTSIMKYSETRKYNVGDTVIMISYVKGANYITKDVYRDNELYKARTKSNGDTLKFIID